MFFLLFLNILPFVSAYVFHAPQQNLVDVKADLAQIKKALPNANGETFESVFADHMILRVNEEEMASLKEHGISFQEAEDESAKNFAQFIKPRTARNLAWKADGEPADGKLADRKPINEGGNHAQGNMTKNSSGATRTRNINGADNGVADPEEETDTEKSLIESEEEQADGSQTEERIETAPQNRGRGDTWRQYCDNTCYLDMVQYLMYHQCYHDVRIHSEEIGRSVAGRQIVAVRFSPPRWRFADIDPPKVLATGGIHGDSTVGGQLLMRWIWYTCTYPRGQQRQVLSNVEGWYVPMLNPDAFEYGTRRNRNRIDIDTNFPRPGRVGQAFQDDMDNIEPETEALMYLLDLHDFKASISFQGGAQVAVYPWMHCYNDPTHHPQAVCPPSRTQNQRLFQHLVKAYMGPWFAANFDCGLFPGCGVNGAAWIERVGTQQDYEYHFKSILGLRVMVSHTKTPHRKSLNAFWNINKRSISQFMSWTTRERHFLSQVRRRRGINSDGTGFYDEQPSPSISGTAGDKKANGANGTAKVDYIEKNQKP